MEILVTILVEEILAIIQDGMMEIPATILVVAILAIIPVVAILATIQDGMVEILVTIQVVETLGIILEEGIPATILEAMGSSLQSSIQDIILEMYLEDQDSILEVQDTIQEGLDSTQEAKVVSTLEDTLPKARTPLVQVTSAVGWLTTTAAWEGGSVTPTMSKSARELTAQDARLSPQSSARAEEFPCVGWSGCLSKQASQWKAV